MGDEGSSSKLDNLGKEDLIKLVKKYIVLHKQLRTKNEELLNNSSKNLEELKQENLQLKSKIDNLSNELEDYKSFKIELEPQLENAHQEIAMNKSMLEMLNNEIKLLNSEKLQLEKKILNIKRNTTPSVIVEEDEEDLEEEKRSEESSKTINLEPIKEEYIEHDPETYIDSDKAIQLSKQIEDMTFYIDELKSELEAEKETNNFVKDNQDKFLEFLRQEHSIECSSLADLKDKITDIFKKEKYLEDQLEKVISNYKQELFNLEQQKNEEIKQIQKEANKNRVLDLEIADFEKSIKNLNYQIIAKDKEINDIKQDIAVKIELINKQKVDIENLEKQRDEEIEKSTKLKQLLVKAKKDVSDAKTHEAEHLSKDAMMRAQIETLNLEIENYKIQIADLTTECQKYQHKLNSNSDSYQRTNQILESKNQTLEQELNESKNKYDTLQHEYENYKIKVQHAFKKQKELSETNTNLSNTNESLKYLNEIDNLKSVILKLNDKCEELQEKLKLTEKENELTQEEYARVLDRNTKLITELKEKEHEWKLKSQELTNKSSNKTEEINEMIRNLKLENEAQQTQYKEKIKNLNSQHLHAIDMLQSQLEDTKLEIDKLNRQIEELRSKNSSSQSDFYDAQKPNLNFSPLRIDINEFKRESSMEFENSSHKNSTKSLEQLLSEPSTPNLQSPNISDSSKLLLSQIEQLKQDFSKSKIQLEHLNELLNESELNNVRLSEQINLLKEEIRRLERNQEREKSISNLEYLKNVVYKFLTFSTPQEKTQLLPVLTTMLKLSQEEQNTIMSYARGTSEHASSGWTNYLPKWSS